MIMQPQQQQQQIDIHLSDEVAQGVYSNLAIITHSHAEFILDFVALMPGIPKGTVRSRIILTPQNAKRLLFALQDNMQKFEAKNGKIVDTQQEVIPVLGNAGGKA
jgi:ribonuclease BN (tRNA processing enzyme)